MRRILTALVLLIALPFSALAGKYYNGSTWVDTQRKYYNGSAFVNVTTYRFNGLTWDALGGTPSPTIYDFEEVGAPAGWTVAGGTPNYDYAGTILEGTESLRLAGKTDAADTRARFDFAAAADKTYSFLFQVESSGGGVSGGDLLVQYFNTTTGLATFQVSYVSSTTYKLTAQASGGTLQSTTDAISVGVTYLVCARYAKGTGVDAIASIGFVAWTGSETCPTSGTAFAESADGTRTVDANRMQLHGEYTSATDSFDNIFDMVSAE